MAATRKYHPLYKRWRDIWRYYELSYVGGADYINPDISPEWAFVSYTGEGTKQHAVSNTRPLDSFLFPYGREEPAFFEQRRRRSWYRNLCQPVVDSTRDHALGESVERKAGAAPVLDAVWGDVDLTGSTMDEWMRNAPHLVFGHAFAVVDLPRYLDGEVRTLRDEQTLGVRPYATWYTPLQVPDWTVDRFGDFDRLVLLESDTRETAPDGAPPLWRILTRTTWEVREGGQDGKIVDEGINPLGRVPVEVLYAKKLPGVRDPIGQSFIHAIARVNQEIYNLDSMLGELEYRQGPFLGIPGGEKLTRAEIGLEAAFAVPVDAAPPAWITMPSTPYEMLKAHIAELVLTVRALAGLSRGSGEESIAARSGEALLVETQDKRAMLRAIRHQCEDFETRFAGLVASAAMQTWDGHVRYSTQFFSRSFVEEVAEVQAFIALPIEDAVKTEVVSELVRRRLAHMDPEQLAKLMTPPAQSVDRPTLTLAPTDAVAVITVNEARSSLGLSALDDGNVSIVEYQARKDAERLAATQSNGTNAALAAEEGVPDAT
jgi:nitrogen fixation protein FixH